MENVEWKNSKRGKKKKMEDGLIEGKDSHLKPDIRDIRIKHRGSLEVECTIFSFIA